MDYFSKSLMKYNPQYLDLSYTPQASYQQDSGGYYPQPEQTYNEEPPVSLFTWGGADKHGKSFGGSVNGNYPTKKGTVSGSVRGMYSNYGKPTHQVSGFGLNYGNDKYSFGANYNTAPVQYSLMPDPYSDPSFQSGAYQPSFVNSEYFDNLYRQNSQSVPNQNFLARGTFRY